MYKVIITITCCLIVQYTWAIEVDPGADRLVKPEELPVVLGGEPTATGGSGTYQYEWRSEPEGFSSTEANPEVSPETTTTYFLKVTDSEGFVCEEKKVVILVGELSVTVDSNNDLRVDEEDDAVEDAEIFRFWTRELPEIQNLYNSPLNRNILEDLFTLKLSIPKHLPENATIKMFVDSDDTITPSFQIYNKTGSGLKYITEREKSLENYANFYQDLIKKGKNHRLINTQIKQFHPDLFEEGSEYLGIGISPGKGKIKLSLILSEVEIARDSALIDLYDIHNTYGGKDPKLFSIASFRQGHTGWGPNNEFNNLKGGNITIFVHGYNVSEEDALNSWFPIIYKRLYWSGHKGAFLGVTWEGYEDDVLSAEKNFNRNVYNALRAAPSFANFINANFSTAQRVDIIAHSLGNMMVSEGLKSINSGIVDRYILHQAAVPSNAYDILDANEVPIGLVPRWPILWQGNNAQVITGYPTVSGKLDLSKVGETADANEDLWVGYFSPIMGKNTQIINTFSRGDDVLGDFRVPEALLILFLPEPIRGLVLASTSIDVLTWKNGVWALNEYLKTEFISILDNDAFQEDSNDSHPLSEEWAYLTYKFPGRSKPMGVDPSPLTHGTVDGQPLGIDDHSAIRVRPFHQVYPFFRELIKKRYLHGNLETITP